MIRKLIGLNFRGFCDGLSSSLFFGQKLQKLRSLCPIAKMATASSVVNYFVQLSEFRSFPLTPKMNPLNEKFESLTYRVFDETIQKLQNLKTMKFVQSKVKMKAKMSVCTRTRKGNETSLNIDVHENVLSIYEQACEIILKFA